MALVTETSPDGAARPVAGCTCCKPPEASTADVVAELEARREDVERRLRRLADDRR